MQYHTLQLANHRQLAYAFWGAAQGQAAFYFHGLPGSAAEGELLHDTCEQLGIRLIAVDRFGYGQSSSITQRDGDRYRLWVQAIQQLADHLQIKQFYLIAASGGAPYALACASLLHERVAATVICCGLGSLAVEALRQSMGGLTRWPVWLGKHAAWLLKVLYGWPGGILVPGLANTFIWLVGRLNGGMDQQVLAEPVVRRIMCDNIRRAFAQFGQGGVEDLRAAAQAWPFRLSLIGKLSIWHGDADRVVKLVHAQWLAQQVQHARLTVINGAGHFSLPIAFRERILKALLQMEL